MKSILRLKEFLGLVEMTSGLVNASQSLSEWQAVKMIFFAPCLRKVFGDQCYNSTFLLFSPSDVMILLVFLSCLRVFFFVKDQIASFQLKHIIVFLN